MNVHVDVYVDGEFQGTREVDLMEYMEMSPEERDYLFGYADKFEEYFKNAKERA